MISGGRKKVKREQDKNKMERGEKRESKLVSDVKK
jgi:hypothetical protein